MTGEIGYLRMHGRNYDAWFSKDAGRDEKYDYLYSEDELDSIMERIEKLREGARLVVVIWNNHFRGKAVTNAFQSLHHLLGEKLSVPPVLLKANPGLKNIAREEEGQLFQH